VMQVGSRRGVVPSLAPERHAPHGAHVHRILLVEDSSDLREAMGAVLTTEGYEVDIARDGDEALSRLRAGPRPCMILLDLFMPVMDGRQFRAEQRSDPALARIPVIVVSADDKLAEAARTLGVAHWLTKPVDLNALLALPARCCDAV